MFYSRQGCILRYDASLRLASERRVLHSGAHGDYKRFRHSRHALAVASGFCPVSTRSTQNSERYSVRRAFVVKWAPREVVMTAKRIRRAQSRPMWLVSYGGLIP